MTKKNLTWKLKEMPTGGELAELVETGVIDKDEAREIMFGSAENDKEKIKALEEQIEFLRDLVTELSKNRQITISDWSYPRPIKYYHTNYWSDTNTFLSKSGLKLDSKPIATSGYVSVGGASGEAGKLTTFKDSVSDVTMSVSSIVNKN